MICHSILITSDPGVLCPDVPSLSSVVGLCPFRCLTSRSHDPELSRAGITLRWRLPPETHQQKQFSLRKHNAPLRTSRPRPMHSQRPGHQGVLGVSCLASGAFRRPFLLPQAPYALVADHSVPPPSATLPFRLLRQTYPYQIVPIGCRPGQSPPSSCLDPSAGIPEGFIGSLPPTAIL